MGEVRKQRSLASLLLPETDLLPRRNRGREFSDGGGRLRVLSETKGRPGRYQLDSCSASSVRV